MTFDALIVGAGPAGVAAAVALCGLGAKVALIARSRSRAPFPEAVEGSSSVALRSLGLWESFAEAGFTRSTARSVLWAGARELSSVTDPYGGAWLVDRDAFDAVMLKGARRAGAVVLQGAARPVAVARGWEIELGGYAVRGALLVLANGRHSTGPQDSSRVHANGDDSVAVGVVTEIPGANAELRVERAERGWWYSVGLACGRTCIAHVVRRGDVPSAPASRRDWWCGRLASAKLIHRVGPESLRVVSARGSRRNQIHGDRWCSVGDAAAAYDPITGQGVAASLMKGAALGALLGRHEALRAFELYAAEERVSFEAYSRSRSKIVENSTGEAHAE
jgi:flavin-dependent dehydrogenase